MATSSLDLQDLLTRSLDTVVDVTAADAAEIWLVENGDELVMRCSRGPHAEALLEVTRFRVGEGIPGIVAQSGEPVVARDLPSDPRFGRRQMVKAGYHTFCALPLRYRERILGVLATAAMSSDGAVAREQELRLLGAVGE